MVFAVLLLLLQEATTSLDVPRRLENFISREYILARAPSNPSAPQPAPLHPGAALSLLLLLLLLLFRPSRPLSSTDISSNSRRSSLSSTRQTCTINSSTSSKDFEGGDLTRGLRSMGRLPLHREGGADVGGVCAPIPRKVCHGLSGLARCTACVVMVLLDQWVLPGCRVPCTECDISFLRVWQGPDGT